MRNVLITGATGAFGRAFVRRLLTKRSISTMVQIGDGAYQHKAWSNPERICIYSRGEHAQAAMRAEIPDPDGRLRWFIGDVRDAERLRRAMRGIDTVIHAAALKRIEVGQYNPSEMVATNVMGAMNVISAASKEGVEKIVALSSDKAYQPISPYGQTKALAEALFLGANAEYGPLRCAVVRYGNVAGSTGSVIPIWRQYIAEGKAVPVTDLGCTRFWMRMSQAVELVLDTVYTMEGGEIKIPELPAYELRDLATAMGADPMVIGLPHWEKRHECMESGNCSNTARRMSVDELREELKNV